MGVPGMVPMFHCVQISRAAASCRRPWAQNWAQGPFGPTMFLDFLDGAGGLPDQFGTFYEFRP